MKYGSGAADVAVDNCQTIACPQFKNSFVLTYKGFFYGKEARKAQPFSGMLWFAWDFGHPSLKFVFCQCKGSTTPLSYVKHE